jgi:protein TonB
VFEHYIHYQQADPVRRRRIVGASVISGTATAAMLLFTWAANKMDISKVEAPTVDYIMVQMTQEEPPPPPPPPPPPAGDDSEEEEEEDIPEEEVPEEEIVQPSETPDKVPDAKKSPGRSHKIPGGVPGGVPGGIPGGVVGGVLGGQLGGQLGGVATKKDPTKVGAPEPINVVKQNAIYSPDPDQAKLGGTKAFMFDKRGGIGKVAFCVDTNGKTVGVKTKKKFPGDPKVDQILRDTIKKWRFKPFMAAGKKRKVCSIMTFDLKVKK